MKTALSVLSILTSCLSLMAKPNVVLIIGDDISPDFSCYGGPVSTPNIDALAAGGMRFENAYVTASSCSPSRNSMITGLYPHQTGAPELHMPLPAGKFMFPLALKEAGYYTAQYGKFHMGEHAKAAFDVVEEVFYPDDVTGAEGWVRLLQDRPRDKPFLMWFAGFDAHRPWEPDPEESPHDPDQVEVFPGIPDTPKARRDLASYFDEVRRFDRYIGKVVTELKAQGVYENTLIMVLADNGRPFPRDKSTLFEGGMQTPLVVHWPGGDVAPGVISESLVSTIDLAPTILDVAGIEKPDSLEGISMLPILADPEATTHQALFGEQNWHVQRYAGRMVRQGDYLYIRDYAASLYPFQMVDHKYGAYAELLRLKEEGKLSPVEAQLFSEDRPQELLFNVENDPSQLNDLVQAPGKEAVLQSMRLLLTSWQSQTGDTIPPLDRLTVDRHDRDTFERLFPEMRPPTGVLPGQSVETEEEDFVPDDRLTYKSVDGVDLKLHVFYPKGHDATDQRPAIVFFFGGGWKAGFPGQFFPHCEYLASRGMVAMAADYRVESRNGTTPTECVKDGKSAIRWLRHHAAELGVDPTKILAGGGSAGGHVAAATALVDAFNEDTDDLSISPRPDALVLFNPVYDNGPSGYGFDRVEPYWESFSPIHNIDVEAPPSVVFLGTRDRLIPEETALKFKRLNEQNGIRSDLHLYADQTHGFFNHQHVHNFVRTVSDMDRFLVSLGYLPPPEVSVVE